MASLFESSPLKPSFDVNKAVPAAQLSFPCMPGTRIWSKDLEQRFGAKKDRLTRDADTIVTTHLQSVSEVNSVPAALVLQGCSKLTGPFLIQRAGLIRIQ